MRRLLAIALAAAAACTSFDPKLPDRPFLCGTNEPRCPDGYTCVPEGSNRMVCSLDGEPTPDASVARADDERAVTHP
jgi:hypothetical protein